MRTNPIVYCVVPVYNRLEITKRFLTYINEQDYPDIHLVIVDDGSTDGTGDYLAQASQSNLTVLKGNGNLWWSGAMRLGMSFVMNTAKSSDYLLMLNDDVRIGQDYISTLVRESVANNDAVVGSSQRDEVSGALLGSGYHIDFWAMRFMTVNCEDQTTVVDALPGRGVLFPMRAVSQAGKVNAGLFPHYLADVEYTLRLAELGWRIVISKTANVFSSAAPSDTQVSNGTWYSRYFSFRSRRNLLQRLFLFSVRGPILLRILAVPRYLFILILKSIRQAYDK